MNPENKAKFLKWAKILGIAALILLALFIFINYVAWLFLPFIIAWIIAFAIQPAVNFINKKLRLNKKLAAVLFLLLLFAIIFLIIFFSTKRLIFELNAISLNFSGISESGGSKISDYINAIFGWLEKSQNLIDKDTIQQAKEAVNEEAKSIITQFGANVTSKIPAFITQIVVAIPKILVFALIMIVSTFYISLDYATISKFIVIQVPPKARNIIFEIKSRFLGAIYKYLRAYAIIIMITYFELSTGFLIIGVRYALILAAIVALIDILPVLGTGTVLIPWGVIAILQKDYFAGFALLILYAVVTVIRQIIEPKIVGKSIGLYPVVTLIALYVGYNLFGFAGMLLFPISILLIKNLNDEGKIKLWKDIKTFDNEKKDSKENKSN